jgi:hypothetical protein
MATGRNGSVNLFDALVIPYRQERLANHQHKTAEVDKKVFPKMRYTQNHRDKKEESSDQQEKL